MKKSTIAILALAPALLCGCAMKCDFAKFKEKVGDIEFPEDKVVKATTIKGKISFNGNEYKINKKVTDDNIKDLSSEESVAYTLMRATLVGTYAGAENKDATYYAGSSFKYETEGLKLGFNKYGLCTKYEGGYNVVLVNYTVNLTASYSLGAK